MHSNELKGLATDSCLGLSRVSEKQLTQSEGVGYVLIYFTFDDTTRAGDTVFLYRYVIHPPDEI